MKLNRWIKRLAAATFALALALSLITYFKVTEGPNVYDLLYIRRESVEFLDRLSETSSNSDIYNLEDLRLMADPKGEWALLSLSRENPAWEEGVGAGGFIAIGRLVNSKWQFKLPQDEDFESWFLALPEELMPPELKRSFTQPPEYPEAQSSTNPFITSESDLPRQTAKLYLPYPEGRKYKINTLPGDGEHQKIWNAEEAIDFGLPKGEKIAASAGGEVIAIKDDSTSGGCGEGFKDAANYMVIKIAKDQTIRYMHLDYHSVRDLGIKLHDKVEAGQVIGRSGNTGWVCGGAHLHIVLEKLCGNRVCDSLPLNFEEFEAGDPQYDKWYESKNQSPQRRELLRSLEIIAKRRLERLKIEGVLENFYKVYACGRVKNCDEEQVTKELAYVTERVHEELFGSSFSLCLFCPPKPDKLESVPGSAKYIRFPTPTGSSFQVRVKSITKVTRGSTVELHHTVANADLIKEGGQWKVDGWEVTCGYKTNESGEVIELINIEGCEWQPPEGSSDGSD